MKNKNGENKKGEDATQTSGKRCETVKLGRSHIQLLQDPGHEGIKGKGHMQVRKKTIIHKEKGRLGR